MNIETQVVLQPYNTFGIPAIASHFLQIKDLETLRSALKRQDLPKPFLLSGGSNILLKSDLDALVLYMDTQGKDIIWEDDDKVHLKIMGGENWHSVVLWSLEKGYGGLENLSLIPGKTGTAPIQNIGAYGVELKDVFVSCEAVRMQDGELVVFDKEACGFEYRDSIFKGKEKGAYVIWSVTLELTKRNHLIRTGYGAITEELDDMGIQDAGPREVSDAVIAIRRRKLPDPSELGNSGSFFKNPIISKAEYVRLQGIYPGIPGYPDGERIKVPAGWLIDNLGLKGVRRGDAGVHQNQALVLVNYGGASGSDILDLAREIQSKVADAYAIDLEPEVNII